MDEDFDKAPSLGEIGKQDGDSNIDADNAPPKLQRQNAVSNLDTTSTGGKGKSKNCKMGGKGGKRKSRKLNNGAKSWNSFVMDIFRKKRASNPKYSFVQALKDASKLKKGGKKSMKK